MAQLRAKQIKLSNADDLLIGGTGGNGTVLTKGTAGQVLKVLTGGALGYEKVAAADTTFNKGTTTLTSTNVEAALQELAGLAGTGVAGVQAELDATQNAVGLNADGSYTPVVGANYAQGTTVKAAIGQLDAALKVVDDAYKAADTTLNTAIEAEETRATGEEARIEGLVTAEVTRATDAEAELRTDFEAADADIIADLAAEVTRATTEEADIRTDFAAADGAIQLELNATQAGAGLNVDGTYAANEDSSYIDAATSLNDADVKLAAALQEVADDLAALGTGSLTAVQTEVDLIETGLGFGADGLKPAFTAHNYVAEAATVVGAITALDTRAKANYDAIVGTNGRIDALGAAFNYVGVLTGGADEASAFDLSTLASLGKDAGDYYKVTTAGYFKVGAGDEFFVNVGDGLVWNTTGGVDVIDNTNANVLAGTNIAVTGSADTGFTVALDGVVPVANGGTGKAALENVTSTTGAITLSAGAAGSVVNAFALTFNPGAVAFADLNGVNAPAAAQEGKFLKWTSTGLAYVSAAEVGATVAVEEDFAPAPAANVQFVLTSTPLGDVAVYMNGVKLKKSGYTVNAGTKTVTLQDAFNGYPYETGDTISVSYNKAA